MQDLEINTIYDKSYSLILCLTLGILTTMEIPKFFASPDSGSYTQPGFKINPHRPSFAEIWADIEPGEIAAIEQYQAIAGAYNNLWKEIYLRTTTKEWERDPQGLGSCNISDEHATDGLDTVFTHDLIQLRNSRNNETPLMGKMSGCPHLRPNVGCVLGDLKGPKCLDYTPLYMDDELEERFGICLMPVQPYLLRVGLAGVNQSIIPFEFHPEVNDGFTRNTVASINMVTDYIKGFPILTPQTPA